MDPSAPLGGPGTIEVTELLGYDRLGRSSVAEPATRFELSSTTVAGLTVRCASVGWHRLVSVGEQVVADLDLERRPQEVEEGGWTKPLVLFGTEGTVAVRTDVTRGSPLRGALRYLQVETGADAWVWHFVGGRVAGEQLVLAHGAEPGRDPVVTTYPAAQGRSLGNPRGGAAFDRHVTSWTADAVLRDVVLVELLATAKLDGLVDYRPARVAEGVQDLVGYVPRPDANTE
jgi:hypothetical protein